MVRAHDYCLVLQEVLINKLNALDLKFFFYWYK